MTATSLPGALASPGGRRAGPGPDVVVAVTAWSDAVARGFFMPADRLLASVLHGRRTGRVVVANPFRSAPVRLARRLAGRPEAPLPEGQGPRDQVTPTRLRRHDPARPGAIVRACARYDRLLAREVARLHLDRPCVILGNPLIAAHAPLRWAGPVTYFAWDDWAAYHPHERLWPAYEQAYARIRERGLRVVAVSDVLLRRLDPRGPAAVVPNGVDPEEWGQAAPPPPPPWLAALPRPRLVYVGTLDERLDASAVAAVAARFPDGVVVLAGPRGPGVPPLAGPPNLRVVGPLARPEVIALVRAADACLLPHRDTPLTRAMSPLKLYEYLAAGRPVVATDLPPVRAVGGRVVLVAPGGDFAAGTAGALEAGPMAEADRQAFVAANSWARRMDDLLDVALGEEEA